MTISNSALIQRNKFHVDAINHKTLRNNSLFLICICSILLFISLFSKDRMWFAYRIHASIIAFISFLTYSTCIFYDKKNKTISPVIVSLYSYFLLFYFGIFFYIKPAIPVICFYGCITLYSIIYFNKTWRFFTTIIGFTIAFIAYAFFIKEPTIIPLCINSITVLCYSLYLGWFLQRTKLKTIETGRLIELQRNTDPLTELPNKIKLFDELEKSSLEQNHNHVSGVFMIDIDFFKKYNDKYGHYAGDLCLKQIGECFASFAKKKRIDFFRYGGEEFIALVRPTTLDRTINKYADTFNYTQIAEELLNAVRALKIPCCSGVASTVTISIGYASCSENSVSPEELISRADKALYKSKQQGRNQFTAWNKNMYSLSGNIVDIKNPNYQQNPIHENFFNSLHTNAKKMQYLLRTNNAEVANSNTRSLIIVFSFITILAAILTIVSFINNWWPYKLPYIYLLCIGVLGLLFYFSYLRSHKNHSFIFVTATEFLLLLFIFYERFFTSKEATDFPFLVFCILFPFLFIEKWEISNSFISVTIVAFSIMQIIFLGFNPVSLFSLLILLIVCIVSGNASSFNKLSLLENNKLLKMQRDTDILTGLPNRRKLFSELARAEKKSQDSDERIAAVYMTDIDFFKKYNDTLGHQYGDACLKNIGAAFISAGLLTGIDFFRYGGEEFAGIVRAKNMHGFITSLENFPYNENAQRLLNEVRSLQIPFDSGVAKTVTLSCGFVIAPKDNSIKPEALIEMADEALYQAKQNGRNQAIEYTNIRKPS